MAPRSFHDTVAPQACACDTATGLTPFETALSIGMTLVTPVPEGLPCRLERATGRVLSTTLRADTPLPPFDNSAMDGYALRLSDLRDDGRWQLPVAGRVCAGDPGCPLPAGSALRILTGAALPEGADAIVAQEDVRFHGTDVVLPQRPRAGQHIRRQGEDLAHGAPLLDAGRVIGPREAALLAAAGVAIVPVRRKLRVAVLCTGSELAAPGQPLKRGQVRDANTALLTAALTLPWISRITLPVCKDDPKALRRAIVHAKRRADIVVTTGGVSVGDHDHMEQVVTDLGGQIVVRKLAMKPGRPLTLGKVGNAIWVGLPGNPVAALVTWHVIGARLAEAAAGIRQPALRRSPAALAHPLTHRPGRCEYRPAMVLGHDARGIAQVACLDATGSHRVAQLAQADALVIIPADAEAMARGELVDVIALP